MLKEVIRQHAGLILEAVVVLAILSLVFFGLPAGGGRYGLGNVLSNSVESDGIDYAGYADSGAADAALGRSRPVISYRAYDADGKMQRIIIGKDISLTTFFTAEDADSQRIETKITSIKDRTGTELLTDTLTGADTFRFSESGTYKIEVSATDSYNRCSNVTFSVPVAGKKQEG